MNAAELILQARQMGHDEAIPYMWSDALLVRLFNEAISEACRRKNLLFDDSTSAVCLLSFAAGVSTAALHNSVRTVTKALIDDDGEAIPLVIVSRDEMDQINAGWRSLEDGDPQYLIVEETSCRLVPAPSEDSTVTIECWRTPLDSELLVAAPSISGTPAIAASHHGYLYHWVLANAYMIDDIDTFDPVKAAKHEQSFVDYFGLPRDADRLRETRMSLPRRVKPW